MATNAKDAKGMMLRAISCDLFLMQGVWSRFFPLYKKLSQFQKKGTLGEIRSVNVSFGFNDTEMIPRLHDPALAGGALLDIGIYCV